MWKHAPRSIVVLLAFALVLLPLLALLQYRWLGQVSESERERMRAILRSSAAQFSETFDAEITRAYSTFQIDQPDAADCARRLDDWEQHAAHARILREIFVVVSDENAALKLLRFDRQAQSFVKIEWPPELQEVRLGVNPISLNSVREEIPALIIPPEDLSQSTAPHFVCTIVALDLDYLRTRVLPELAERYFSTGKALDYDLAVVSRHDPQRVIYQSRPEAIKTADLSSSLFEVRPNTLPNVPSKMVVRVVKRQRLSDETAGAWQLLVSHRGGSLEEAVARGRRRNLALGFGVLALLGLTLGLIVLTTARASRLAQDQINFVAGVSHELRTPLAVIRSAGENLADGLVRAPPQITEYGTLIRDEGRRLSHMVEQILTYAGPPAYNFERTDLRELIEKAAESCAGFSIESNIASDLPMLNADAAALQRALQNLLGNAMKYSGTSRWIGLRARKAGDEIQITIEDRGLGIPRDEWRAIFNPFHRGRAALDAQIPGSGLGLSLVQQIAQAHGGRVTLESSVGRGSTFTIHLPA